MLSAHQLTVARPGSPHSALVAQLNCVVQPGQFMAVLGCNGAGKTLTLHTLAGLRPAASGEVRMDGRALGAWQLRERARNLGLLAQVEEEAFPATVLEGALAELMDGGPKIDAVFCNSDLLALGVLTEAQARSIAVPEHLAIVGFGDLEFAADLHPALTTVHINGTAIGRQAAQFIVDRAEGHPIGQSVIDIGFSIVDRQST